MNNRELALALLEQASELLCEGARYRKEMKDKNGHSSHSYGRKEAITISKHRDNLEELRKAALRMTYHKSTSSRARKGTYASMSKEEREKMYQDTLEKACANSINLGKNKELGKTLSDYNNSILNRRSNININQKINNRSKSQNESISELLIEAAELLSDKKYKPNISGFKCTDEPGTDYSEKIRDEIEFINKNLTKILKESCDKILEDELKCWTENIIKREGTTPEKEFKPGKLINKEFYTKNSKVYLVLSFKWYPAMIYEVVIVNNKVYDVYCIGD